MRPLAQLAERTPDKGEVPGSSHWCAHFRARFVSGRAEDRDGRGHSFVGLFLHLGLVVFLVVVGFASSSSSTAAAASLTAASGGATSGRGIAAPRPGALSGIGSFVFWTKWVPFPLAVSSAARASAASFWVYSKVPTGLKASFMTVQTIRIRAAGLTALTALALALAGALGFFFGFFFAVVVVGLFDDVVRLVLHRVEGLGGVVLAAQFESIQRFPSHETVLRERVVEVGEVPNPAPGRGEGLPSFHA